MAGTPSNGELTPEEAQRAQEAITFLNEFVPTAWAFFRESLNSPLADSFVARAKKDADLVLVLDAALWIDAAGDFLLTLVKEFQHGEIHRFSPYTSLRGALECDAWACWLLDPDSEDRVRLGRALTLRARSLFETKRLRLPFGATGHSQNYKDRMERVTAAAQRWGLEAHQPDSGRISFISTPGPTALIRCLLPEQSTRNRELTVGEQTYGELSARAHGTPWAMVSNTTPVERLNEFQTLARSELDVFEFIRLLGVIVSLHDKAIRRVAVASGVDAGVWDGRRGAIPRGLC
jgi:hypothetical protein